MKISTFAQFVVSNRLETTTSRPLILKSYAAIHKCMVETSLTPCLFSVVELEESSSNKGKGEALEFVPMPVLVLPSSGGPTPAPASPPALEDEVESTGRHLRGAIQAVRRSIKSSMPFALTVCSCSSNEMAVDALMEEVLLSTSSCLDLDVYGMVRLVYFSHVSAAGGGGQVTTRRRRVGRVTLEVVHVPPTLQLADVWKLARVVMDASVLQLHIPNVSTVESLLLSGAAASLLLPSDNGGGSNGGGEMMYEYVGQLVPMQVLSLKWIGTFRVSDLSTFVAEPDKARIANASAYSLAMFRGPRYSLVVMRSGDLHTTYIVVFSELADNPLASSLLLNASIWPGDEREWAQAARRLARNVITFNPTDTPESITNMHTFISHLSLAREEIMRTGSDKETSKLIEDVAVLFRSFQWVSTFHLSMHKFMMHMKREALLESASIPARGGVVERKKIERKSRMYKPYIVVNGGSEAVWLSDIPFSTAEDTDAAVALARQVDGRKPDFRPPSWKTRFANDKKTWDKGMDLVEF